MSNILDFLISAISIHAPTRGATIGFPILLYRLLFQSTLPRGERRAASGRAANSLGHFNPRSHEGSDPLFPVAPGSTGNFNPRSHEGSDYNTGEKVKAICYFNPRSHEGSDKFICVLHPTGWISIHAPTRGATNEIHND